MKFLFQILQLSKESLCIRALEPMTHVPAVCWWWLAAQPGAAICKSSYWSSSVAFKSNIAASTCVRKIKAKHPDLQLHTCVTFRCGSESYQLINEQGKSLAHTVSSHHRYHCIPAENWLNRYGTGELRAAFVFGFLDLQMHTTSGPSGKVKA